MEWLLCKRDKLQIYETVNNTNDNFLRTDSKANLPRFSGNITVSFYEADASKEVGKHFCLFLQWL